MPSSPPTLRRLSPDEQELYIGLSLAYLARLSQEQLALLLTISQRTIRRRLSQDPDSLLKKGWVQRVDRADYDAADAVPLRTESLWELTEEGHEQFRRHAQYPLPILRHDEQYPAKPSLPRKRTANHDWQVADTVVQLVAAARERTQGLTGIFCRFEMRLNPFHNAPIADALLRFHATPPHQQGHPVPWIRDLPDDEEHFITFAVEVDMDTESLQSVIRGKAVQYQQMFEDVRWRQDWIRRFGHFPLILWVVPDERRRDAVSAIWSRAWPEGRFYITTFADLHDNFWLRYQDQQRNEVKLFVPMLPAPAALPPPTQTQQPPTLAAQSSQTPTPAIVGPSGVQTLLPSLTAIQKQPSAQQPPREPAMVNVSLHIAGMLGGNDVNHFIGPLTLVFYEEASSGYFLRQSTAQPLIEPTVVRYRRDETTFTVPSPGSGMLSIRVPSTGTTTRFNARNIYSGTSVHHVFDVPWPLPPGPPIPAWDATAQSVDQTFRAARRQLAHPQRLQQQLLQGASDCVAQRRKDWALLRLLWRTPAALPGLGVFIWLAALCVIFLGTLIWQLTWRLLRAASLLFVGYIWFSRGLHWVVQTIYRLCKRNPYKMPLRIAAQSLLGVMLLFSGLFIVEIWFF